MRIYKSFISKKENKNFGISCTISSICFYILFELGVFFII